MSAGARHAPVKRRARQGPAHFFLPSFLPCDGDSLRARAGWVWRALSGLLLLATLAHHTPAQAQNAGICGRTEQVRNAILNRISGVTDCANVTAAHLTAITSILHVTNDENLTAIADGDFDGLTALTTLNLGGNALTTLPSGVFDELTALTTLGLDSNALTALPSGVFDELTVLTTLYLDSNDLTTPLAKVFDNLTALTFLDMGDNDLTALPSGVFDELTALTTLELQDNDLTTLPSGVFDKLTALTFLDLEDNALTALPSGVFDKLTALTKLDLDGNSGAPFSPTADALPDDGTVSSAGGTVTLDGSGSSGPWGTNVTYSWAASGATVTFDDAMSVTPTVTIPQVTAGAELVFTLTVTGRGGTNGIAPDTDTATVTVTAANAAPSFTSPASFDAAENQTAVGTVEASDGDTDDSVTGYAIQGGADASKFTIVASTGVVTFASPPNFEDATDADTEQRLRGGGAGDERRGRTGEDGGPDDHGDGDGCGGRGAGRTGRAGGVVGFGDERDGDLGRAFERRAGDHGLRLPAPGEVAAGVVDGGDGHDDDGARRDDHAACGGHRVRGAGSCDERRGHWRLVRIGQRLDGRDRLGAVID